MLETCQSSHGEVTACYQQHWLYHRSFCCTEVSYNWITVMGPKAGWRLSQSVLLHVIPQVGEPREAGCISNFVSNVFPVYILTLPYLQYGYRIVCKQGVHIYFWTGPKNVFNMPCSEHECPVYKMPCAELVNALFYCQLGFVISCKTHERVNYASAPVSLRVTQMAFC